MLTSVPGYQNTALKFVMRSPLCRSCEVWLFPVCSRSGGSDYCMTAVSKRTYDSVLYLFVHMVNVVVGWQDDVSPFLANECRP